MSTPPTSSELLHILRSRAQKIVDELPVVQRSYRSEPNSRTHGALTLAVSEAQHLSKLLDKMRVHWKQHRQRQHEQNAPGEGSTASVSSLRGWEVIEAVHVELRRALPHAVAALGETPSNQATAAADTAAALRSLLHTRSMLLVEQNKVKAVVTQISTSAESLNVVNGALGEVEAAMQQAQHMVRRLLRVQSCDDVILRVSVVLFVLALAFVVLQRVFRLFPMTVYVEVD